MATINLGRVVGEDGRGIVSIEKTDTNGLVDTYTITYTDGTTSMYEVKNGEDGTGEGGTSDYATLSNKPSINNVELDGNKTIEDLGILVPRKISELENDNGFITMADVPTDDSYTLVGQTPMTLSETSTIKLAGEGEINYSIKTPTIWKFDDSTTFEQIKCTFEKIDGHYKVVSDSSTTAHYQAYLKILVRDLEIGKSYTFSWDVTASKKQNATAEKPADWGGKLALYCGETTDNLLTSSLRLDYDKSYSFVAEDEVFQIRYYPSYAGTNMMVANSIGRFNTLFLNEENSIELTEPYKNEGVFSNVNVFSKVPKGASIISNPIVNAYTKSATDKTLTKSDTPADAEATGEAIEQTKALLPLYGKTIVNFGDSIFGNQQPPVDISTFLAEKSGATVYNCGFGGCRMTPHPTSWYDAFSMYNLADAITTRDFTLQDAAVVATKEDDGKTVPALAERYGVGLERLKGIDFTNVDIITIAYGANDFSGAKLDNEENLLDTTTFGGALRYSIEKILATYPNLKIFILSIAYRFWVDTDNDYAFVDDANNHVNGIGKYIKDYNAKLKEVAEEYNLPYVDDFNIGIGKHNRSHYFSKADPAHHLETGRRLIAEHLAKELH